jgi:uncharacterized protein
MGRLASWLLDAIVLFLLARMVVRLLTGARSVRRQGPTRGPRAETPERSGGTLVRDPHCGTYVPQSRAIASRSGIETLYFCSAACRDAYERRP